MFTYDHQKLKGVPVGYSNTIYANYEYVVNVENERIIGIVADRNSPLEKRFLIGDRVRLAKPVTGAEPGEIGVITDVSRARTDHWFTVQIVRTKQELYCLGPTYIKPSRL